MSDVENQRDVDLLLGNIVATHRELVGRYEAHIKAGEAFLAEVERDRYSRRLRNLRDAAGKASDAASLYFKTLRNSLHGLHGVLKRWKSPGSDYAEFVKKANEVVGYYSTVYTQMVDSANKISEDIIAIDEAAARR